MMPLFRVNGCYEANFGPILTKFGMQIETNIGIRILKKYSKNFPFWAKFLLWIRHGQLLKKVFSLKKYLFVHKLILDVQIFCKIGHLGFTIAIFAVIYQLKLNFRRVAEPQVTIPQMNTWTKGNFFTDLKTFCSRACMLHRKNLAQK